MLVCLLILVGFVDGKILLYQGVIFELIYGGQLQDVGIFGVVLEGKVWVDYELLKVRFEDGIEVELCKLILCISQFGYGLMYLQMMFFVCVVLLMIGFGLFEVIFEEVILVNVDLDDCNGDGICGCVNQVWDVVWQCIVFGCFGWKVGQLDILQQNVYVFVNDMGLISSLLFYDDCSVVQVECCWVFDGGELEVSDNIFVQVLFYSCNLVVLVWCKVDDLQVLVGKCLFVQVNCVVCYVFVFIIGFDVSELELVN